MSEVSLSRPVQELEQELGNSEGPVDAHLTYNAHILLWVQEACADHSLISNEVSSVRKADGLSAGYIHSEGYGVCSCVVVPEGGLETSGQSLRTAHRSLGRRCCTLAPFHLRVEAYVKIYFQSFLSVVATVVNGSLRTHLSDLIRPISDLSYVLKWDSCPITGLLHT